KQIFFILLFYVIGESISFGISSIFPNIFIPGTILGMLLLVLALLLKVVKNEYVEDVGIFLTSNMAFFFIPAAVSVIEYFDLLKVSIIRILSLVIISLVVSFFSIMGSVKLTIFLQDQWKKRGTNHE
ncbi:MAG: CidA/LrgA family protein, partial [Candidatus Izemoplasmatales bacterium]|nr:CidA/LrgA family protein [Candidatus Izemoplasmatales bacterium]